MPTLVGRDQVAWIPLGYQRLTVTANTTLNAPPAHAVLALVMVEGGDVRWRDDGTNPTTADGMPLRSGSTLEYFGNPANLRFTAVGGSAVLHISLYQ